MHFDYGWEFHPVMFGLSVEAHNRGLGTWGIDVFLGPFKIRFNRDTYGNYVGSHQQWNETCLTVISPAGWIGVQWDNEQEASDYTDITTRLDAAKEEAELLAELRRN